MGPVDALGVEHGERVEGHLLERVRPGRAVAAPGAPVVDGVAAVAAAEGQPLEGPAPGVGAEALDHEQRRAVATAEDVVVDRDAVLDDDLRHRSPLRVPALPRAGCSRTRTPP